MRQKVQAAVEAVQYGASFVGMAVGIGAFSPARATHEIEKSLTTEQWIGIGSLCVAVVGLIINGWMKRNDNRRADVMTALAQAENLREEEERAEKRAEHAFRMHQLGIEQDRRSLQQTAKE